MLKQLYKSLALGLTLVGCTIHLPPGYENDLAKRRNATQTPDTATASNRDRLPYCQNTNDCGAGDYCYDRGDGLKLCMGSNGVKGDFCQNGNHCGTGLWCKPRGDGLKVCM